MQERCLSDRGTLLPVREEEGAKLLENGKLFAAVPVFKEDFEVGGKAMIVEKVAKKIGFPDYCMRTYHKGKGKASSFAREFLVCLDRVDPEDEQGVLEKTLKDLAKRLPDIHKKVSLFFKNK